MLRENLEDSISYVTQGLVAHPLTYINTAAIAVSMSDIELAFKIGTYCVSIVASLLVIRKYLLEIKKLKREENNNDFKNNVDE